MQSNKHLTRVELKAMISQIQEKEYQCASLLGQAYLTDELVMEMLSDSFPTFVLEYYLDNRSN